VGLRIHTSSLLCPRLLLSERVECEHVDSVRVEYGDFNDAGVSPAIGGLSHLAKRAHLHGVDGEAPGRVTSKALLPSVAGARSLPACCSPRVAKCVPHNRRRRHDPAISPSTASPQDEQGSRDLTGPPVECSSPASGDVCRVRRVVRSAGTWPAAGGMLRVGGQTMLSKEGAMSAVRPLVDIAGRPRSPATVPGFHAGRAPRNKGSCRRRHDPLLRGVRPRW
jgi:hypothetical protein